MQICYANEMISHCVKPALHLESAGSAIKQLQISRLALMFVSQFMLFCVIFFIYIHTVDSLKILLVILGRTQRFNSTLYLYQNFCLLPSHNALHSATRNKLQNLRYTVVGEINIMYLRLKLAKFTFSQVSIAGQRE